MNRPSAAFPIEVRGSARQLLGMSPAQFLRDYWQKRPLLIRGAFADFEPPVDLPGVGDQDLAAHRQGQLEGDPRLADRGRTEDHRDHPHPRRGLRITSGISRVVCSW